MAVIEIPRVGPLLETKPDSSGNNRLLVDGAMLDGFGAAAFHSLFGDQVVASRRDIITTHFASGILPHDLVRVERWDGVPSGAMTAGELVDDGTSGAIGILLVATEPIQIYVLDGIFGDTNVITGRDSGFTVTLDKGGHGAVTEDDSRLMVQSGIDTDTDVSALSRRVISYISGHDSYMLATAAWLDGGLAGTDQHLVFGHKEDGYGIGFHNGDFGALIRRAGVDAYVKRENFLIDTLDGSGDENNPSGYDITTKTAFLIPYGVRFGYLGVIGAVYFLRDDQAGRWIPFHKHTHGGALATTVVLNPRFRVCAEITKVAAPATNVRMVCGSWNAGIIGASKVILRRFFHEGSIIYVKPNEALVFSMRNKASFNGKTNLTALLLTKIKGGSDGTKRLRVRIWKNAILTGGTAWVDHETANSFVETRVPASFTGGEQIDSFIIPPAGNLSEDISGEEHFLYPSETLTYTVQSTQNADVDLSIHWGEFP